MTCFVLIHGGLHGAWCWKPLMHELTARGARGFAFDLPGHGQDLTPRQEVTLQAYISAAEKFIARLPVDKFTLVGHSLAGVILPDLAETFSSRITEVIYVAGMVPGDGERPIDLVPESRRPSYYELAASSADCTFWIDFEQAKDLYLSGIRESEAKDIYEKLTPQPFNVYLDAATMRPFTCPVRYVICDRDAALPPELCLSWADKIKARVQHLDSGHDAMLSKPGNLAELLLN